MTTASLCSPVDAWAPSAVCKGNCMLTSRTESGENTLCPQLSRLLQMCTEYSASAQSCLLLIALLQENVLLFPSLQNNSRSIFFCSVGQRLYAVFPCSSEQRWQHQNSSARSINVCSLFHDDAGGHRETARLIDAARAAATPFFLQNSHFLPKKITFKDPKITNIGRMD